MYGRVPLILPGIDQIAEPNSSQEPLPGLIRDANRLREVSVQAMIEGSASARLGRAMNTRTTMAAQHLELRVGDEVDFYQDQLNKDTSGWFGPAIVADVSRLKHGAVTVRYNNKLREVSVQKVRRHLFFLCFLSASPPKHFTFAWSTVRAAVESLDDGTSIMLGHVRRPAGYVYSPNNAKLPGAFEAVRFLAENHLHLPPVIGARLSLGFGLLKPLEGYTGALTIVWKPNWGYFQNVEQQLDSEHRVGSVNFRKLYPEEWSSLRSLQLLLGDEEVTVITQDAEA